MTRDVRPPASAIHPARLPWSLAGGSDAHDLVLGETVAADAQLMDAWYPRAHQVLVQWERGFGDEPPYREFGLTLWAYEPQRSKGYPWQPVWALRRSEFRQGAEGLRTRLGDFTGDGHDDLLVFVDTDGTAGCGRYLAVVDRRQAARTVLQRAAAAGDATAAIALGATYDPLVLRKLGVLGMGADLDKARSWYQKAERLGSPEAARRLELLAKR